MHFVPQMAFLVSQHCGFQCLGIWGVYLILFFFLNNFILFIYFGSVGVHCCTGFLSLWRAGVPLWLQHSSSLLRGQSCCGACTAACTQLRSLWLQLLGSRAQAQSTFVAHGLSCSAACGIFPSQKSSRQILFPLSYQAQPT